MLLASSDASKGSFERPNQTPHSYPDQRLLTGRYRLLTLLCVRHYDRAGAMTLLITPKGLRRTLAVAFAFPAGAMALVPTFPAQATPQQVATIADGIDVRADADSLTPYVEQTIAVNPLDPSHIVGASMKAGSSGMVVAVVTSRDGGRTWKEVEVESCGFDPWLAFHRSGTVLLVCLKPGTGPDPVLVLRSEDGGATWQGPIEIMIEGTSFDHPTIVADTAPGPNRGSIHIVVGHTVGSQSGRARLTAPAVITSRDAGRTFSPPVRLQNTNVWAMPMQPLIMPDGDLGFSFLDFAADYRQGGGFRVLGTKRLWWATSQDDGRTLSMSYLADERQLEGYGGAAVDGSSGPFRGRIYVANHDVRGGEGGVYVVHSADGGETWSKAVQVGSGFVPDSGYDIRLPALAVNNRGDVLVTWFAATEQPGKACGRLTASASIDGGESFLPPVPVADAGSCNDQPGNVVDQGGNRFDVTGRWQAGGDYYGLIALPDGSFRPLWSDSRTGVFQLWTDRIEVKRSRALGPGQE